MARLARCVCLRLLLVTVACSWLLRETAARNLTSGSPVAFEEVRGLVDPQGRPVRLSDWTKDRLTAFVFLGVECPLVQLYAGELNRLHREYADRGVTLLGVFSNRHDSLAEVAAFAPALEFPLVHDPQHRLADALGATRTPEVLLLDSGHKVLYRGRIDDRYEPGVHSRPRATRPDLENAVREALARQRVKVPRTEPVGCLIDRETNRESDADPAVNYAQHIAPILDAHCATCHRPGEAGPFPLLSYDDALAWRDTIREVIQQRRMPPWHAIGGPFENDPSLTAEQRQQILAWVDAGAPQGDPQKRPPRPNFAEGWTIEPDVVLDCQPFTVPAEGVLDYQEFVLDPHFDEDTWVQAIEVRPGNRSVVHHATVYVKPKDAQPGMFYFDEFADDYLAMYVPGNTSTTLPRGAAKRIPAGWNLVLSVHYVPTGSEQTDQSRVGLRLCSEPELQIATRVVAAPIELQPHEVKTVIAEHRLDDDYLLIALYPHMHLRGRWMRLEWISPAGQSELLLEVPQYDFEWQHRYVLRDPRVLSRGGMLRCTAEFDNSAANPRNPDPTALVRSGPATTDEMFFGAFELGKPAPQTRPDLTPAWTAVVVAALWVVGRRARSRHHEPFIKRQSPSQVAE